MTTKEWLSRATNIDKEIDRLIAQRDAAFSKCINITTDFENICVSGTKDPHKFDLILEHDKEINLQIDKLCEIRREITEVILEVSDEVLRKLLIHRYIHGLKWEEVAEIIDRPAPMTKIKLHARALLEVENIIKHKI